jgi:stearoyl-CoA desaturase (delta-9 desaturase)
MLAGDGVLTAAGLWHAHIGWMFSQEPLSYRQLTPDLLEDRTLRRLDRAYPLWVLLGLVAPAAIGGIVVGSWSGAALGLLWGGLLRIFIAHHVTWCINSLCRALGTRPCDTRDGSRNDLPLAVLTFGEGWHNNHHASPASAGHGIGWWQFDPVYWVTRVFERVGLVHNVRVRDPNHRPRRRPSANKVAEPPQTFDPTPGSALQSEEV